MRHSRNKVLVVDIDLNRKDQIHISHANRSGDNVTPTDKGYNIISDMATLCEALCTLIHAAEDEGIKKSPASLRDCIKHLEDGFADASYFTKTIIG